MKRNALIMGVVLSLLASACGSRATPTVNPLDIQHTAEASAFTMVAQTLQALPTATPLPPTDTPTPTSLATETPLASPSPDPLNVITSPTSFLISTPQTQAAIQIPTPVPTSNADPCNQPLTSWQGPSANLTVANETKPKGEIILSLYVVTDLGQCGYLVVYGSSLTGPVGQYSAGAFVTGKQNMKVFGGFRITEGSWKIVVRNDIILAAGGCYPNC